MMFAPGMDHAARTEFARDVRAGLGKSGQKELPSSYLYDEIGAALFEAITVLPEYGLTRADARLLELHSAELASKLPGSLLVGELGSGSGRKTRWILEALAARHSLHYYPIDISRSALVKCRGELGRIRGVTMEEIEQSYLEGLSSVIARRKRGQAVLILFLGSTIGNFDREEAQKFLQQVRDAAGAGRCAAAGYRSGQARGSIADGVQRSDWSDGRVQPERAGENQPRAGRRIHDLRFRAPSPL